MDEVNRIIRRRARTRWETRSGTFSTASSQLVRFFSRHRARWNVLYRSLLLVRVAELWALDGRVQCDVNGRRWMTAVWISRVRLRVRACVRAGGVLRWWMNLRAPAWIVVSPQDTYYVFIIHVYSKFYSVISDFDNVMPYEVQPSVNF